MRNGEGYPDPTPGRAIHEADKPPEIVTWYIKMVKDLARLFGLEIIGRIQVRDVKTKREYR